MKDLGSGRTRWFEFGLCAAISELRVVRVVGGWNFEGGYIYIICRKIR